MPLTIHHYYPFGSRNIGDELVAHALRTALTRRWGAVEFINFPVNATYRGGDRTIGLCGENLERGNAEADVVLVGGSNLLEPRKPTAARKGLRRGCAWGVVTDCDSLKRLQTPLVLLGMGTGSRYGRPIPPLHAPAVDEIRLLFGKAVASAVRDVPTVRQLAQAGITTECTGCPVTFLTDREIRPADPARPLIVSFPPGRILRHWTGRLFMRSAMQYVDELHRRRIPLLVTLHEEDDAEPARRWVPRGVPVAHPQELSELIECYEQSRGVIGFRLHAALLGLGLGKPVIPVGVDWRGLGFIETFGLHDLGIRAQRLGQFTKLRRLTDRLLHDDPVLLDRLNHSRNAYRARYEQFLTTTAERLSLPTSQTRAA